LWRGLAVRPPSNHTTNYSAYEGEDDQGDNRKPTLGVPKRMKLGCQDESLRTWRGTAASVARMKYGVTVYLSLVVVMDE